MSERLGDSLKAERPNNSQEFCQVWSLLDFLCFKHHSRRYVLNFSFIYSTLLGGKCLGDNKENLYHHVYCQAFVYTELCTHITHELFLYCKDRFAENYSSRSQEKLPMNWHCCVMLWRATHLVVRFCICDYIIKILRKVPGTDPDSVTTLPVPLTGDYQHSMNANIAHHWSSYTLTCTCYLRIKCPFLWEAKLEESALHSCKQGTLFTTQRFQSISATFCHLVKSALHDTAAIITVTILLARWRSIIVR